MNIHQCNFFHLSKSGFPGGGLWLRGVKQSVWTAVKELLAELPHADQT